MSFSDHKITAFQHKITDLPDQPSLPANELKARFDKMCIRDSRQAAHPADLLLPVLYGGRAVRGA